ncbi:GntR family transcriptional regulator [Micromonospora echinofusca]|uniref:GntR family transcriptional regulator n=1 Tax=Micromonospora echinofusca TaxID=47858 RepID=A0ABS3VZB2_MICEH|nr:GntR family transcriptional regulator [Micromonospora echinofusca]MBO4209872.1 GntR family transcriptional regulator [Micromonospora echinofusca]
MTVTKSGPFGDVGALPEVTGGSIPAHIHELLEEAIITGVLAPGTRMRADLLAAEYGVSRIPVREALRSLHEAGWVDIRPRYGVYVRDRSVQELRELVATRAVIEASIAGWTAQRRSTEDLNRLRELTHSGQRADGCTDPRRLSRLVSAYWAVLREAAGNQVMAAVSVDLEKRTRFYLSAVPTGVGGHWPSALDRLTAFLDRGDVDAAATEARGYVTETGATVGRLLTARDRS